jgi:hypothetical protein
MKIEDKVCNGSEGDMMMFKKKIKKNMNTKALKPSAKQEK